MGGAALDGTLPALSGIPNPQILISGLQLRIDIEMRWKIGVNNLSASGGNVSRIQMRIHYHFQSKIDMWSGFDARAYLYFYVCGQSFRDRRFRRVWPSQIWQFAVEITDDSFLRCYDDIATRNLTHRTSAT